MNRPRVHRWGHIVGMAAWALGQFGVFPGSVLLRQDFVCWLRFDILLPVCLAFGFDHRPGRIAIALCTGLSIQRFHCHRDFVRTVVRPSRPFGGRAD